MIKDEYQLEYFFKKKCLNETFPDFPKLREAQGKAIIVYYSSHLFQSFVSLKYCFTKMKDRLLITDAAVEDPEV